MGPGRSATCDGSICTAIDPTDPMPLPGMCEPRLGLGQMCNPNSSDLSLGRQCDGVQCDFGDPPTCTNDPDGLCIND